MELFAERVININLNLLSVFAIRSILDVRLCPEFVSTGGYKTVLRIQTNTLPRQQMNMTSRGVITLRAINIFVNIMMNMN